MKFTNKVYTILSILLMAIVMSSCSKDDESETGGEIGESDLYAHFNLTGGEGGSLENGQFVGDGALIAINTNPEEGATVTWSTHRTSEEENFWRLDIGSIEGANYPLTTGTYILGSIEDAIEGEADFTVAFQSHTHEPPEEAWPFLWGGLGDVQGTLTITEIQNGVLDNGTRDLVTGTFEFTAADNNINGDIDQPPLSDIVVTNGEFSAKLGEF